MIEKEERSFYECVTLLFQIVTKSLLQVFMPCKRLINDQRRVKLKLLQFLQGNMFKYFIFY